MRDVKEMSEAELDEEIESNKKKHARWLKEYKIECVRSSERMDKAREEGGWFYDPCP